MNLGLQGSRVTGDVIRNDRPLAERITRVTPRGSGWLGPPCRDKSSWSRYAGILICMSPNVMLLRRVVTRLSQPLGELLALPADVGRGVSPARPHAR